MISLIHFSALLSGFFLVGYFSGRREEERGEGEVKEGGE